MAKTEEVGESAPEQMIDICPMCREKQLVLMEKETEVPYFGKLLLFSMTCNNCKYHLADVEALEEKEPVRYTFEVQDEKDMNVRVVKSSEATVKIPYITTIEPGPAAQGYVTNIEGLLNRVKYQIESVKETAEDDDDRVKAKNLLKKIFKIKTGQERMKIIIEDPSGNSAIISDRAVKERLKVT
jgi:zinc finger protein